MILEDANTVAYYEDNLETVVRLASLVPLTPRRPSQARERTVYTTNMSCV